MGPVREYSEHSVKLYLYFLSVFVPVQTNIYYYIGDWLKYVYISECVVFISTGALFFGGGGGLLILNVYTTYTNM